MAGVLVCVPHGIMRGALLLATPLIAGLHIWLIGFGNFWPYEIFGFDLELMRVDRLSRIFVIIFCLASFLGNMFAWHLRDTTQQVAALLYAGSAIGAALSGDLISLFFLLGRNSVSFGVSNLGAGYRRRLSYWNALSYCPNRFWCNFNCWCRCVLS